MASKTKPHVQKASVKKSGSPRAPKSPKPLGKITHFYDNISVAVVALNSTLKKGDSIKIGKNENFFEQQASSMQLNHKSIPVAKKGQVIGLKVSEPVRQGTLVFKAD